MLVNTHTANKLIADVCFGRADFAKDDAKNRRVEIKVYPLEPR